VVKLKNLEIIDKELFLKYAIPCGHVLVNRGSLEKEVLERLNKKMIDNQAIRENISEYFPVAAKMTTLIAKRLSKDVVDEEVVRQYFLQEHDQAVKWRSSIFPDIPKDECMIQPGKVKDISEESLLVNTPRGELEFKRDFVPEALKGDMVTVHYDFVSEMIDKESFDKLMKMRL
jgi:hydrogenase maturation factor